MSNDTKLIKQVLYNLQKLNEKKKKLTKKQQKIDVDGNNTINAKDFELLRKQKSKKEVEDIGEKDSLEEILESFIQLHENPKSKNHVDEINAKTDREYKAGRDSAGLKGLKKTVDAVKKARKTPGKADDIAAYKDRDEFEASQRKKNSKAKSENLLQVTKNQLNEFINEAVEAEKLAIMLEKVEELEEKKKRKKRKKKKKKSGKSSKGLSAAVKKSLDKKADRRGLTRGSVYAEFRKGLAAYYTSGSRKGMSAHQWAHARVNSANPSKSWAVVKKRKGGKKKKK